MSLWSVLASAADIRIVDAKRNIQMYEDEPVVRDFYLSGGSETGLKENLVVEVRRKINVRDSTGTQSLGDLNLPVGRLKILWAQNGLSLAREYERPEGQERAVFDQLGLQIGDRIELKGAFIDKKKSSVKRSPSSTSERESALVPQPGEKEKNEVPTELQKNSSLSKAEETLPSPKDSLQKDLKKEATSKEGAQIDPGNRAQSSVLAPAG